MKKKTIGKALTILIPILLFVLYLLRDMLFSIVSVLPPCFLYSHFHLYCPGCGNTRSVAALFEGDILSAMHYNPVPILLLVLAFAGYIELATDSFGRHIRILPRKLSLYLILITLVLVYLLMRNFIPVLAP